MCGICGIVDYTNKIGLDAGIIGKMSDRMRHRGPDDEGTYLNNREVSNPDVKVGLGHRRLSIIDLSSDGHQPMSNEDKTIWVVLNGEIYNFLELRLDLEKKGHSFKSRSDTEVIVHLYEEYGEDCVKYLRGMFAFGLWDEKKNILLLVRDRVGKKPLLYYYKDGVLCFASEFSAMLAGNLIDKRINFEAIDYYLSFGYIPAPLTIYKDVFKLPPAHMLVLKDNAVSIKKYWELDYSGKIKISEEEAAEETLRLLKEAVSLRLHSDVPLGAFLSGGIDSSAIVALMCQLSNTKVKTFSIGFEEESYNELGFARNIAKRFCTDHNEFIVRPNALEILPLLVERYGEPYADSSCIPMYYVSSQTKKYVTVALNGDGGDELFAGYERYQAMIAAEGYQKMPGFIRRMAGSAVGMLPDSINSKDKIRRIKRFLKAADLSFEQRYLKWVGIFDEAHKRKIYSEEFSGLISQANALKFINTPLNKVRSVSVLDSLLYADTVSYLPNDLLVKVDIMSMANSLEARSPFLDHKLMEFTARLPAEYKMKRFIKKYILKKAIKGLVPRENIYRRKMGFGVPIGEWFRSDLKGLLIETLLSEKSLGRGYFNPGAIRGMVKMHIDKRADFAAQLWSLLMLELWHARFID